MLKKKMLFRVHQKLYFVNECKNEYKNECKCKDKKKKNTESI